MLSSIIDVLCVSFVCNNLLLDDEASDSFVFQLGPIDVRHHQEYASVARVGDPHLGPVDYVVLTIVCLKNRALVCGLLYVVYTYITDTSLADVCKAKASLPALTSDRQKEPTVSLASLGRYLFFCSSLPYLFCFNG